MDFYNKILYSKDLEFTYHSKIKNKKKIKRFLQKNKNPMPLIRLTTHLGKVKTNQVIITSPIKSNHNYSHHIIAR